MLLFIVVLGKRDIKPFIFQYISCYCLSSYGKYGIDNLVKFQYISCYCLSKCLLNMQYVFRISIHLMLLFIGIRDIDQRMRGYFNTSHVTVYPVAIHNMQDKYQFQYISCYCLSNELTPFYIFLRI